MQRFLRLHISQWGLKRCGNHFKFQGLSWWLYFVHNVHKMSVRRYTSIFKIWK